MSSSKSNNVDRVSQNALLQPFLSHCGATLLKLMLIQSFKEIVHSKMKILSSFIYLHLIPNLNDFMWNVK